MNLESNLHLLKFENVASGSKCRLYFVDLIFSQRLIFKNGSECVLTGAQLSSKWGDNVEN